MPRFLLVTFILSLLVSSCAPSTMTLEQAKQVTVSMGIKAGAVPPRTVQDILDVLAMTSQEETEELKEAERIADSAPPANGSPQKLGKYYLQKSVALLRLARFEQAYEETLRMAAALQKVNVILPEVYFDMAHCMMQVGEFGKAIEYFELAVPRINQAWTSTYQYLVEMNAVIGNLEKAGKWLDEGTSACARYASNREYGEWHNATDDSMRATFLDAQGKHSEAEPLRRRAISYREHYLSSSELGTSAKGRNIQEMAHLVGNLWAQGKYVEAEMEARRGLVMAIKFFGGSSQPTALALSGLGESLLRQGRIRDAEQLSRLGLRQMEGPGIQADSHPLFVAKCILGNILVGKGEYSEAIDQYDEVIARKGMFRARWGGSQLWLKTSPDLMLAMIKTGRYDDAAIHISAAKEELTKLFGAQHYRTAEMRALMGLLHYAQGRFEQSLEDFSIAIPLLAASERGHDYLKRQRFIAIMEGYLDLLREIGKGEISVKAMIDPVGESFKVANLLLGNSVSSAMAESSARASITDPDLADLVRREQDAAHEISALENMLFNISGMPADRQEAGTSEQLRERMATLGEAKSLINNEIQKRFPRYVDLTSPRQATPDQVKERLRGDEVLIVVYPAESETYIWCVPRNGETRFAVSKIGKKEINRLVTELRRGLTPDPVVFGDIPPFDTVKAHQLYQYIFEPVAGVLKGSEDLLIVASGALGQIPFAVLPTRAMSLKEESGVLFSRYKDVPWLARQASVTNYPDLSSLLVLRDLPDGNPRRKPFAGFGDPVFSKKEVAPASNVETAADRAPDQLLVRGVRITTAGKLDNKRIDSVDIEKLNRLPDTAVEIKEIAQVLGADAEVDTFIRERASERQVKTMNLADRRVVAFASHALLPWDLDGLDQPALALSSPSVTGDNEDGLLKMSEIMRLRLNADLVVLSACNTGASEGGGAEAVSGLGKAFFYAGSRAALVTMWPVETTSAKNLMISLFEKYAGEKQISLAQAQRKAMLDLVDKGNFIDRSTGKLVASYAHPFFWAPYIIMGDGSKCDIGLRN